MQSKVPLYPYGAKEARERGEIEKWRESFRENCACAGGIDILIRENFDGMHLKSGTVEKIVELYGYKRVEHVLANTVQERRGDGRFRPSNREWANSHYIPPDEMHNRCFAACTCLGDGEQTRWNRNDFVGVLKDEYLPDWAKESLKQYQRSENEETQEMQMGGM